MAMRLLILGAYWPTVPLPTSSFSTGNEHSGNQQRGWFSWPFIPAYFYHQAWNIKCYTIFICHNTSLIFTLTQPRFSDFYGSIRSTMTLSIGSRFSWGCIFIVTHSTAFWWSCFAICTTDGAMTKLNKANTRCRSCDVWQSISIRLLLTKAVHHK